MSEKKSYRVSITETLKKVVVIEAESAEEAEDIVRDNWKNSEYILDAEDFEGVTFNAHEDVKV